MIPDKHLDVCSLIGPNGELWTLFGRNMSGEINRIFAYPPEGFWVRWRVE